MKKIGDIDSYLKGCEQFKDYKGIKDYIEDVCICLINSTWHYSETSARELIDERMDYVKEAFSDEISADECSTEVGYVAG